MLAEAPKLSAVKKKIKENVARVRWARAFLTWCEGPRLTKALAPWEKKQAMLAGGGEP